MYVNSSNIAKIMNLGSPKGIPIIPIIIINTNTINTEKFDFVNGYLLFNDISAAIRILILLLI